MIERDVVCLDYHKEVSKTEGNFFVAKEVAKKDLKRGNRCFSDMGRLKAVGLIS